MKKYIDAEKFKNTLRESVILLPDTAEEFTNIGIVFAMSRINSIPAADVKEVIHGEWIEKEHWIPLPRDYEVSYDSDYDDCYNEKTHSWKEKYWHCSCCSYEASRDTKPVHKYCPNCGAKMKNRN